MASEVQAFINQNGGRVVLSGRRAASRPKSGLPSIAPGCTNSSKEPRFHYLCEKHKEAPKKDYEVLRLQAKQEKK